MTNFYLLDDILKRLNVKEEDFLDTHQDVELGQISKTEFLLQAQNSQICDISYLESLKENQGDYISLVGANNKINEALGVFTENYHDILHDRKGISPETETDCSTKTRHVKEYHDYYQPTYISVNVKEEKEVYPATSASPQTEEVTNVKENEVIPEIAVKQEEGVSKVKACDMNKKAVRSKMGPKSMRNNKSLENNNAKKVQGKRELKVALNRRLAEQSNANKISHDMSKTTGNNNNNNNNNNMFLEAFKNFVNTNSGDSFPGIEQPCLPVNRLLNVSSKQCSNGVGNLKDVKANNVKQGAITNTSGKPEDAPRKKRKYTRRIKPEHAVKQPPNAAEQLQVNYDNKAVLSRVITESCDGSHDEPCDNKVTQSPASVTCDTVKIRKKPGPKPGSKYASKPGPKIGSKSGPKNKRTTPTTPVTPTTITTTTTTTLNTTTPNNKNCAMGPVPEDCFVDLARKLVERREKVADERVILAKAASVGTGNSRGAAGKLEEVVEPSLPILEKHDVVIDEVSEDPVPTVEEDVNVDPEMPKLTIATY